jgi:citrate lyase subunit beta / citryl-CoA lyase
VPEEYRSRRSCLAVPGSSQRFLDKARGLAADEVFLDLEDAVAPAAKEAARRNVIAALTAGGWGGKLVAVRVNGATTRWAYRDVAEVVAAAGRGLDAIIVPKVTDPGHVVWLDLMLGQIEQDTGGEPGRIGIEAQIEDARGLARVDEIAAASPRLRALVFGPGRLHGQRRHAVAAGGGAARRVRGLGCLSLPAAPDPGGGARPRPGGHRRALPGDR